jgi:hypothetical protein
MGVPGWKYGLITFGIEKQPWRASGQQLNTQQGLPVPSWTHLQVGIGNTTKKQIPGPLILIRLV